VRLLPRLVACGAIGAAPLVPAAAPSAPIVLIVSQRSAPEPHPALIDLAPYVARNLEASDRYTPLIYKGDLPAVRDALRTGALLSSDVIEPLSAAASRKIASALGAGYLLRVSGRRDKAGVSASAVMERRSGLDTWTMVFQQDLKPYQAAGKKPSLLEGIFAQAGTIAQQITGAPTRIASGQAAEFVADPAGRPTPPGPETAGAEADVARSEPASEPKGAGPHELLANQFRRQGDSANLIVSLRKAVNDRPRDVRLRRDLAQAYRQRGWHSLAREEAVRAIAVAPADAGLHRLLGECLLADGDADAAVREMAEAVRLGPADPANQMALGDAYWSAAKPDEAQKAYAAAVQADPRSAPPHLRLARIYAERSLFEESVRELAAAKNLTPQEDDAALLEEYGRIVGIAEAALGEVLARLQATRKALLDGAKTREQAYSEGASQTKRADQLSTFVDALPVPAGLARVHSLYEQAAGLVSQAAEGSLQYIESQNTRDDEEATVMRVEASKQLAEASRRLKLALAPPSTRSL
jgi:tetratricopeptide (TPR) repeat protein